jgi:hypothetical protein
MAIVLLDWSTGQWQTDGAVTNEMAVYIYTLGGDLEIVVLHLQVAVYLEDPPDDCRVLIGVLFSFHVGAKSDGKQRQQEQKWPDYTSQVVGRRWLWWLPCVCSLPPWNSSIQVSLVIKDYRCVG